MDKFGKLCTNNCKKNIDKKLSWQLEALLIFRQILTCILKSTGKIQHGFNRDAFIARHSAVLYLVSGDKLNIWFKSIYNNLLSSCHWSNLSWSKGWLLNEEVNKLLLLLSKSDSTLFCSKTLLRIPLLKCIHLVVNRVPFSI